MPGTLGDDPPAVHPGHLDLGDARTALTLPSSSPTNSLHGDREGALAALLVGRVVAQDPRPGRPRVARLVALGRRQRVLVELRARWPAPCRCATPRQSAAVSPPPMMITCLPAASIERRGDPPGHDPVGLDEVLHRQVDAGAAARPGVSAMSRPASAPQASSTASWRGPQLVDGDVDADVDAGHEPRRPRPRSCSSRRSMWLLLQLEVGDAVAQQAADRVVALVHGDRRARPGPAAARRRARPGRSRPRRRSCRTARARARA